MVNDHDFESLEVSKVLPHGLYNIYRNISYITLGTSHDTSELLYSSLVVESRLFPHLTKACEGVIFKSIEVVNEVMSIAQTSTGLKVFTFILNKTFETERKVANGLLVKMKIKFDKFLPQFNEIISRLLPRHEVSGVI